jgi:hypothetical protein
MTFYYDDLTDVMHILLIEKAGPSMHLESPSGSILLVERETNRLVGVTVLYFLAKLRNGSLELPELASAALPKDFLDKLRDPKQFAQH